MRGMKIAVAAGAIFGAVALVAGVAGAAPAMLDPGLASAQTLSQDEGALIPVYDWCGPYAHRGPYGGCRPGGQWGGYRFGGPYAWRSCPPGFHIGPYGRYCWPN